jgi:hypothetical protein
MLIGFTRNPHPGLDLEKRTAIRTATMRKLPLNKEWPISL